MQKEYSPLIFASKISRHFKKNIWLKLENLNKTGNPSIDLSSLQKFILRR